MKKFQKSQMKKHCLNSSIFRPFFKGAKIPSMSKGEKGSKFEYSKFCVPASDKSIHSGAFSFNKKLTNPPKGVKGIE